MQFQTKQQTYLNRRETAVASRRLAARKREAIERFNSLKVDLSDCKHERHLQKRVIVPATDDHDGTVLDGGLFDICTVCNRMELV